MSTTILYRLDCKQERVVDEKAGTGHTLGVVRAAAAACHQVRVEGGGNGVTGMEYMTAVRNYGHTQFLGEVSFYEVHIVW